MAMGWTNSGSPAKSVTLNPGGRVIDPTARSIGTGAGASAAQMLRANPLHAVQRQSNDNTALNCPLKLIIQVFLPTLSPVAKLDATIFRCQRPFT